MIYTLIQVRFFLNIQGCQWHKIFNGILITLQFLSPTVRDSVASGWPKSGSRPIKFIQVAPAKRPESHTIQTPAQRDRMFGWKFHKAVGLPLGSGAQLNVSKCSFAVRILSLFISSGREGSCWLSETRRVGIYHSWYFGSRLLCCCANVCDIGPTASWRWTDEISRFWGSTRRNNNPRGLHSFRKQ